MKFVKNIGIHQETLDYIISTTGIRKPELPIKDYQLKDYSKWVDAGYDLNRIGWEFYTGDSFNWTVPLPFEGNISWWFSKLNPGDIFPMHVDTYNETVNVKRYWVAYTDYQPGHIFTYDNILLTDYKAGDMFEFTDPTMNHGACNIGFTPKISLQISIKV